MCSLKAESNHVCDIERHEEQVDPRVQIELEQLNTATDEINSLEVDLDEARAGFRQLLQTSTIKLDGLSKKLGSCIEKARPYYEARMKSKEALVEAQKAAVRFERANSAHAAAKEMVFLAEEGLSAEGRTFDHAWQEMLNHATMRVNESELERTLSEDYHKRTSLVYRTNEAKVQQLQKDLKRTIAKSRPYFETKAHFNKLLEEQKKKVKTLETQVSQAKTCYATALRNLEQISDEIHKNRKCSRDQIPHENGSRECTNGHSENQGNGNTKDENESDNWSGSESTGSADSDPEPVDEYLRFQEDELHPPTSYLELDGLRGSSYKQLRSKSSDGDTPSDEGNKKVEPAVVRSEYLPDHVDNPYYAPINENRYIPGCFPDEWSEMSVSSDQGDKDETEINKKEVWTEVSLAPGSPGVVPPPPPVKPAPENNLPKKEVEEIFTKTWINRSAASREDSSRRQSLDTLASGVKEILSQGIMKLNISSLTERRNSEPRLQIFSRDKKAPSPLEKTMSYLVPDEDSSSDTESLTSVEMLTDDQISSLMLDQEIQEAYNEIICSADSKEGSSSNR